MITYKIEVLNKKSIKISTFSFILGALKSVSIYKSMSLEFIICL